MKLKPLGKITLMILVLCFAYWVYYLSISAGSPINLPDSARP